MKKSDELEKLIDQGPCYLYWRLSYRRRLIRDIWIICIGALLAALLVFFNTLDGYFIAITPIFGLPQVLYNLYKWRTIEKTNFFKGYSDDPQQLMKIDDLRSALRQELYFYGKTLVVSLFFALIILKIHQVYMYSLIESLEKWKRTLNLSL